jgi:hypothetical protein
MATASMAPNATKPGFVTSIIPALIRPILFLLVIIDIVLGVVGTFFPRFYMDQIQPDAPPNEPVYLLQRAAVIWLGYLVVQAIALFRYRWTPEWVLVVAFLRLVEVPADTLYVIIGTGIGWMGRIGLIVAPVFNLIVGILFIKWYFRCGRNYLRQVL